ncbi:hypothetical protein BGZ47_002971 [Haplosporangium gracile]|nr:hypothetical protein BGZ47_002971 [Haplosporangium gracile]
METFDLYTIYKDLLASNEGDILVKLKDGKQLKIVSFLIKKRSPVFKAMLESSMQEAASGVIDLSRQYSLEAFREFMAHIYYNKKYIGSYVPLLFEILCITDYYGVEAYARYINDWIIKLITNVPICLTIAYEALKHGTLTDEIYTTCLEFLKKSLEPQKCKFCPENSKELGGWHLHVHTSENYGLSSSGRSADELEYMEPSTPLMNISELPDFIVNDVISVNIDKQEYQIK